jgi:LysM repeat protein
MMTNNLKKHQGGWGFVILLSLAAILVMSVLAISMQPAAAQACSKKYTVMKNDTLYSVAATMGVAWEDVVRINGLKPPYVLTVGQLLCIPSGAVRYITTTPGVKVTQAAKAAKETAEPAMKLDGYSNYLSIEVTNFPKSKVFYIRGGEGWPNDAYTATGPWVRLGRLVTDKNGSGSTAVRLPVQVSFSKMPVIVCLKDTLTDYAYCKYYFSAEYLKSAKPTAVPTSSQ